MLQSCRAFKLKFNLLMCYQTQHYYIPYEVACLNLHLCVLKNFRTVVISETDVGAWDQQELQPPETF